MGFSFRATVIINEEKLRAEQELANDEIAEVAQMPLSLLPIYLALYATSHTTTASPGDILSNISKILPNTSDNARIIQAAQEVSRAAGGELHNTSAVTGGMAAQEMIKIITKQYVPIDNTCIFDGIGSRCQVLRL
jgi:NEDD8-activating enzyme E1 regulatory subunit